MGDYGWNQDTAQRIFDPGDFTKPTERADLTAIKDAETRTQALTGSLGDERTTLNPGIAGARGAEQQTRYGQAENLGALQAAATGAVPSAAEIQGKQQAGIDAARQFALAKSIPGHSAGGALRTASLGAARVAADNGANATALRATEQANARNALTGALQGMRTQDQGTTGQYIQQQDAILGAQVAASGQNVTAAGADVDAQAKQAGADNAASGAKGGGIAGAIGGLFSDRRLKTDIQPGDNAARALMDSMSPETFERKATGEHELGIIAQDVERTPLGREIVEKDPDGYRAIDIGKGLGAALASLADLNDRLKKLEAR